MSSGPSATLRAGQRRAWPPGRPRRRSRAPACRAHLGPLRLQIGHRRLHEGRRQRRAGDARATGVPALHQGLAHHGGGQPARRPRRDRCSARPAGRARSAATHSRPRRRSTSPTVRPEPARGRACEGEVVQSPGLGHAPPGVEHPPGQRRRRWAAGSSGRRSPGPRSRWPLRPAPRAGPAAPMAARYSPHGGVARQDQMVAVVDHHVELGIEVGAAAPARLGRALVRPARLRPRPARATAADRPDSPAPTMWTVPSVNRTARAAARPTAVRPCRSWRACGGGAQPCASVFLRMRE